jgi:hypothetical protein
MLQGEEIITMYIRDVVAIIEKKIMISQEFIRIL